LKFSPLFHQPDPIEQPEGNKEESEEKSDEASEEVDSWQRSSWTPVEDGPGADGEDEKFEREGDEKTIALNLTLELGGSEAEEGHSGQEDHDDGGEEGKEGEEGDEELTNVTLARGSPTKLLISRVQGFGGHHEIGHASHGGVVGPVFLVRKHLHLGRVIARLKAL